MTLNHPFWKFGGIRNNLESALRRAALDYKFKFPEVKTSPLIREWEKMTELKWE